MQSLTHRGSLPGIITNSNSKVSSLQEQPDNSEVATLREKLYNLIKEK
jgi:hypothetical protein